MAVPAPNASSTERIPFTGASLLPLPRTGTRTFIGTPGTRDCANSDLGLLFYTEFRGIGPPLSTLGRPGDIYLNTSPDNPELYARLRDLWVPWGGPRYRNNVTSHPLRGDLYLWCTRDTGPVWQAMAQDPFTELHDTGSLVTAAQCVAGWLKNRLKHASLDPKQTTLRPNNSAQGPGVERTVPSKRKNTANTDDAPRLSKKPSPVPTSKRSYTFHADSNDVLSFPVEKFSQSFPFTSAANHATPSGIGQAQNVIYSVQFSHYWGPSSPSDSDGSSGDIFFVVSSEFHRIFIKLDTWVEWLGLCSPEFRWFTHPELPGMVSWIDWTQATWITMGDFISRCKGLQGRRISRRYVLNPHDCVTELLPKAPLKLLPRYFRGFETNGLLLSWKLGFEHCKAQNRKLLGEIARLKDKLKEGTHVDRLHRPTTVSEAGMQTDWSLQGQGTTSVGNTTQHTSIATQTSPTEDAEPPLTNTLLSPLLSPTPAPSTPNAFDGRPDGGPNIGQTSALSAGQESSNDGTSPVLSALPLADGYIKPRALAIEHKWRGNTSDSAAPSDLSLANDMAVDAGLDAHPQPGQRSIQELPVTIGSLQLAAPLGPGDFRSNFAHRSEAPSGRKTPVREVDDVQPTADLLQFRGATVSCIEADMVSRNPHDTTAPGSSEHSYTMTEPEVCGAGCIPESDIRVKPGSQLTDAAFPAVDVGAASGMSEVMTEDFSSKSDEDCYLDILFHVIRNSTSRVCRLCLQLEVPQVLEYPRNTPSSRLLAHCETKHNDMYQILTAISHEQLIDIRDRLSAYSLL